MADNVSTSPAPSAPATKTPRDNALQSKRLANAIASAEREIQAVLGNPDLLLALATAGYNETALNDGLALFRAAQEKFTARQLAMAAAADAKADRDHALANAKMTFSAYRQTVQVNYSGADRANLGAAGRMPDDLELFRTNARSAYTTAMQHPYASVLANYGFTTERLNLALTALDELSTIDSKFKVAHGASLAATEVRNEAGAQLAKWMSKFHRLSRVALKGKPALRAQLPQ